MSRTPTLRTVGLTKSYGSVEALVNVSIELFSGEVVALVGDNGAGKSTLVKCVSGSIFPSSGEIFLEGKKVEFRNPGDARSAGVETVYQQLALVDTFDIPGNIYLGRELKKRGLRGLLGVLDRKAMRAAALKSIEDFGARFPDLYAAVETMSGGQRQVVAMTRGAHWGKNLLLLDEPTAALGVRESKSVLEIIEKFRNQGDKSILIISHNMDHVWQVCDRILVLRRGHLVADLRKSDTTKSDVVAYITGAHEA
ncbi:MAG: sugar ABC transporter ATP-binding protein [Actinobacteria bacterium]|nr:sugar ABC transporter ATP-binding protein [Actinomycetota bacterium]